MKKFKLFIENLLVYGLGGIISKIIPLIMVPIITRLMPNTEYYGLSDLSNTLISIGSALAVMGMYDAMYRMFFEKDENEFKKKVCSTAFLFTLMTSVVVFLLMCLLAKPIATLFFKDRSLGYLVYLSAIATLVGATNSIISACFLRHDGHHGQNALRRTVRWLLLGSGTRRNDGPHRHGQQPHGRCVR